MISCSRCAKWQCQLCAGISSETYAFLSNREDFAWYCPPCKLPAAEDVLNGIQIEKKCQNFFDAISTRLTNVEQSLNLKECGRNGIQSIGGGKLCKTDSY